MSFRGGGAADKTVLQGFTLAEVLITLGVIGIVAAMTLPALITRNQNKALEESLKKNYSVILQAFDMYQAEHGKRLRPEILGGGNEATGLKAQIMPYFNTIADCGLYSNNHPACIPYTGTSNNPYKTFNGHPAGLTLFDDGQFVLADGSLILIENTRTNPYIYLTVDVNGRNKTPNKWGHDLFSFQIMNDRQILPVGAPGTGYSKKNVYCSITSTADRNGIGCTYYAINDKFYFNNLPK